jgi:hypothetical protein
LKTWLQTVLLLAGVLIVVAGIVLVMVTGLDPVFGPLGLLVIAAGLGVMWRFRGAASNSEHSTVTTGRSFQRPLTAEEKERGQFRGKIR